MTHQLKKRIQIVLAVSTLLLTNNALASEISVANGKKLFYLERLHSKGESVSCTLCHTTDARQPGKTRANKVIEPLAPVANPKRFTDEAKVEKWFTRNCKDVLERLCTAEEKQSFILYMKSIQK